MTGHGTSRLGSERQYGAQFLGPALQALRIVSRYQRYDPQARPRFGSGQLKRSSQRYRRSPLCRSVVIEWCIK